MPVRSRLRALVVDDSVVVRRMLTNILESAPGLEVVGTAATAAIALQKLPVVKPDVVLLDIEMPEMDGIEAVKRIRASWPKLPIVMCSSLSVHGAELTLRALASGATDYVAKPSRLTGATDALALFRDELLLKVRSLGAGRPALAPVPARSAPVRGARGPVSAIAIGASTGGPNALTTVLAALPTNLGVPVFIAQHMPPLFTKLLADRLGAVSGWRVAEAVDGELVEPGRAYVAPGNHHLRVVRDGRDVRIALDQGPPENSCRPAVDVLFRSVARVFGRNALGAVLTGMGRDGAAGSAELVRAGGAVIVQDEASCVVASMPNAVAEQGIADGAFPIDRLGHELAARVQCSLDADMQLRTGTR